MKAHLLKFWDELRSSYWFIPTVMTLSAFGLAIAATSLDSALGSAWLEDVPWLAANKPDGARAVLSTVAGSMITVAGVVFSITIAAVSYASGQYGPRLLTQFLRDTGNQITLGTFIATFVYCLHVLRTVRSPDEMGPGFFEESGGAAGFVPHIGMLGALALALCSIGVLIYFIHHVPNSIHVSHVIATIGRELSDRVETLFPERMGEPMPGALAEDLSTDAPDALYEQAADVRSRAAGYLQRLDEESLFEIAEGHDLLLDLRYRPGDFVDEGSALLLAWPAGRFDDDAEDTLRRAFVMGRSRTAVQDVRFLVDELVEIAGRALSPGINDPFTAISCLQWLGNALQRLAHRQLPPARRYGEDGALRVVAQPTTYTDFIEAVFGQLRPYIAPDRNASFHTAGILGDVAGALVAAGGQDGEAKAALRAEADALLAACEERLHPKDAEEMRRRHRRVVAVLSGRKPYEAASAGARWLGGSA